jgi:hypothetical protein
MARKRGDPKTPGSGRKKGTPNKVSRDIRRYVLDVVDQLDAKGLSLLQWAENNQTDFWTKVFRAVMPRDVKLENDRDAPLIIEVVQQGGLGDP